MEGNMNAERVWDAALGQLQLEMPRATFDTWVRDAELLAYEDGTFIIGVQNAYARDWLDDRLRSTVSRVLTSVTGRSSSVRFVVWHGEAGAVVLLQSLQRHAVDRAAAAQIDVVAPHVVLLHELVLDQVEVLGALLRVLPTQLGIARRQEEEVTDGFRDAEAGDDGVEQYIRVRWIGVVGVNPPVPAQESVGPDGHRSRGQQTQEDRGIRRARELRPRARERSAHAIAARLDRARPATGVRGDYSGAARDVARGIRGRRSRGACRSGGRCPAR